MTSPPPAPPVRHRLVQAPVAAVDVDGLRVVAGGTVLFAVAAVLGLLFDDRLAAAGHSWWISVCAAGAGLGLLGLAYCAQRVRQRRRAGTAGPSA